MLQLGWHTAAIVPELAQEIRIQNEDTYRETITWMEVLTQLIEKYQHLGRDDIHSQTVINEWILERRMLR